MKEGVDLGWKVNHAYMFIPNDTYSYHSYEGDMEHDRWIANINFYTEKHSRVVLRIVWNGRMSLTWVSYVSMRVVSLF